MGWVDDLHDKVVGVDTAPLIYFIEENADYVDAVRPFFEALDRGDLRVVTSTVTLLEVLIHPFRQSNRELARQYEDILLNTDGLSTISLSPEIAEIAAQLRAQHNLRTPDAVQIATAISAGATYFLTNDSTLPDLPDLKMLVLDNLKKRSKSGEP